MRHLVFGKRLSRDTASRKALLANLANSLIEEGRVTTTLAKAKFARPFVEKLVTYIKSNKLYKKRELAAFLTKKAFRRLLLDITPKLNDRTSGYTRIIKLGPRRGDSAPMARIEFLNWEKSKASQTTPSKKKNGRRVKNLKINTKNKEGNKDEK
ncbi:50S ribosomal protein L17 [Candidatus Curtissbacteria bacterium RIFCSPHIGHO2_02_FULL_40_17]|uniref:50S ribosomal protein L17 n=4 Tax=Candidatus Curtissiibacteriota TaxID=1752717 RepID=A0A1F5GJE0_9BACT|nr:MAG: 50S ribosomal protein L17 [Candidatus Curtissbacteria bacterium RIFCSPHIGHO2_01_FULL_40_12]OGD91972.1 MAG: 50S ribosomal protein L17 [Candidatus Curtissbacteria bacterium RIFCSPHIGHO2_02_FULL_40_17]OGE05223.1 MAG: 50S ribosomal protein L17 [Candidatus Curtissbacteria bacterium RIFCSPHIGHO2_12_FULL_41_17]OGE08161.1 MAG: 50S ribosomal protein L17 [Candidatus Curtissbacteria bacterium RIFCSPLOWO2_02_FULL_40_13b]